MWLLDWLSLEKTQWLVCFLFLGWNCGFAICSRQPMVFLWRCTGAAVHSLCFAALGTHVGAFFFGVCAIVSFLPPLVETAMIDVDAMLRLVPLGPFFHVVQGVLAISFLMRDNDLRDKKIEEYFHAMSTQKDAFIATVSHEIRTPLHGILASVQMMEKHPASASMEHVAAISHCTNALKLLIDNVLGIGAQPRPHRETEVQTADLMGEVEKIASALVVGKEGLRVRTEVGGSRLPRTIRVCEAAALQVLLNLVSNAIKFSTSDSKEVVIVFGMEGEETLVADVVDEGTGVRPEFRKKLFSAYSRDNDAAAGTGLGLMICRKVANQIGGDVTYSPRKDGKRGSIFSLHVPVSIVDKADFIPRAGGGGGGFYLKPKHNSVTLMDVPEGLDVLVVEDNFMNRKVMISMLATLKIAPVGMVSDGASALQFLLDRLRRVSQGENVNPLVVLLDNTMPVMMGTEVARLWRELEYAVDRGADAAKIVLVTASEVAKTPHVDEVVLKPVRIETLKRVLMMF